MDLKVNSLGHTYKPKVFLPAARQQVRLMFRGKIHTACILPKLLSPAQQFQQLFRHPGSSRGGTRGTNHTHIAGTVQNGALMY